MEAAAKREKEKQVIQEMIPVLPETASWSKPL